MNLLRKSKNTIIKSVILLSYAIIIFIFSKHMINNTALWPHEKNMRLILIMFTFIFFEYGLLFELKKNSSYMELVYKILPSLALIIAFYYIGDDKVKYMPLILPGVIVLISYGLISSLLLHAFTITLYYFTGFLDVEILVLFIVFFVYVFFLAKHCDRLNNYIFMCIITGFSYIIISITYQYMIYEKINYFTLGIGIIPFLISVIPLYFKNILVSINKKYLKNSLVEICDDENELLLVLMTEDERSYFHSLNVADVSVRVAKQLNADILLVNAGARFHEIGKLKSRDYVSAGITILKENKFPVEVIKIVREHNSKTNKPKSIEAAIVMLADSIETTIGSIMETRGNNFNRKQLVENIIDIRFDTGMLDYALKDLEQFKKLRKAFISIYS